MTMRLKILALSLILAFSSVLKVSGQDSTTSSLASVTINEDIQPTSTTRISAVTTNEQVIPSVATAESKIETATTSTQDEQDSATTTVDSLSVNLDETGLNTTVISNEDSTITSTDKLSEESEEGSGIEGKSINGAYDGGNSLQGEPNGKLVSVDFDNDSSVGSKNYSTSSVDKYPSHLNLSQIDEIYAAGRHNDEQETAESWRKLSKKLRKGVGTLIGNIVPYALNMTQEAKISGNCSGAMLKWVLGMNQLKAWAIRMLDATGKPIAGLLEGSLTLFGNYRECLKVRAPDDDEIEFAGEFKEYFRGKYCIIQAKPWLPEKSRFYNLNAKLKALTEDTEENPWYDRTIFDELNELLLAFNFVNLRMDLCIPSLCSREDIQKVVNFLTDGIDIKARVLRCEMDAVEVSSPKAVFIESGSSDLAQAITASASTDSSSLTYGLNSDLMTRIYWVLIPALAIVIVSVATAISAAMGNNIRRKNKFSHAVKSLSLKRSVDSHLKVDYNQLADDKPLALYGVRFVLIFWVILVESAVNLKFEYLRELLMLKDLIFWWPMQIIINSTLQFDSIILLTAFTMSYKNCLNYNTDSAKTITKFVIDKYVRLMPSIMTMVAIVILLPFIYSGPVWNDYVTKQAAVCQSTGWLNTVFLQNYLPYREIVSIRTNFNN